MKSEIKEILEEIKDYSEHEYLPPCCELTNEDCKILLDYITNLQEKYEEADNDRHKLFEQKEKAVEYIENLPVMFYPDDFYEDNHKEIEWDRTDLLNILNGGDNNE